jgi:hypothetical protein
MMPLQISLDSLQERLIQVQFQDTFQEIQGQTTTLNERLLVFFQTGEVCNELWWTGQQS